MDLCFKINTFLKNPKNGGNPPIDIRINSILILYIKFLFTILKNTDLWECKNNTKTPDNKNL